MEKPSTLITGVIGAFIVSTSAMVLLPNSQIGNLQPAVGEWDGSTQNVTGMYPVKLEGVTGERLGRRIYAENGCFYCHTQQVRDLQYGPDMERGWGTRRTVARDYLYEDVPLLGVTRVGPDFANYGAPTWRNEPETEPTKPARRDEAWVYRHLYNPRVIYSNSNCPPMPHLFEWKDTGGQPSPEAVAVNGNKQFVPTPEARLLARYLLSLNRTPELKEAPTMIKPKEAKK